MYLFKVLFDYQDSFRVNKKSEAITLIVETNFTRF